MASALRHAGPAAWLLILGALALVALAGPSAGVSASMWSGRPELALPLIARHATLWRLANLGFVVATVCTAAGVWVAGRSLGEGATALATAAAWGYAAAGTAWLVGLSVRLWVTPGVAASYLASGSVAPSFGPLARLGGALFAAFIVVGCGSLAALGIAVVLGGVVPAWWGWAMVVASLAILAGFLLSGDTLPAFVYGPTLLLGLALLAQR